MGQKMWGYRYALAIAGALAIFGPLRAEDGAAKTEAKAHSRVEAERRIEAALDLPLKAPLEFVQTPLNQIMAVLSEDYEIPILFDTNALDAVACNPEIEVTINVGNVSLRSALDLMLRNAGAEELTYIIDHEVLLITTREEAEKQLETRVYRVEDLIVDDRYTVPLAPVADLDSLIDVIMNTVEKDSWSDNGTGDGEIYPMLSSMLVVSQTRQVHNQIDKLLQSLRTTKAAIDADTADQRALESRQPVTSAFLLHNRDSGASESIREAIREIVQKSVDWDHEVEGVDSSQFFLHVLPRYVVVRHVPEVTKQVGRVVDKIGSAAEPLFVGGSGYGCDPRFRKDSGRSSNGSTSSKPETSALAPEPDLAEPAKGSEDKEKAKPKGGGRGGF